MSSPIAGLANTRRSMRAALEIPILISGCDIGGTEFSVQCTTCILSRHGAAIDSPFALAPEQEIMVSYGGKEAEARVVGRFRDNFYGVAFLNPELNFWDIAFSTPSGNADLTSSFLKCKSCDGVFGAELTDVELMQLENTGELAHQCPKCRSLTNSQLVSELEKQKAVNRRRSPRTKIAYQIVIRHYGQEVPGSVLDASVTGLRMRSKKRFKVGDELQISEMHTGSSNAIWASAKVAWAREIEGGHFEHGLKYLK